MFIDPLLISEDDRIDMEIEQVAQSDPIIREAIERLKQPTSPIEFYALMTVVLDEHQRQYGRRMTAVQLLEPKLLSDKSN